LIEKSHPFESDILCCILQIDYLLWNITVLAYNIYKYYNYVYFICILYRINGLEPGWLGASFGLRICYVRIIITRNTILNNCIYKYIVMYLICNVLFHNFITLTILVYTVEMVFIESIRETEKSVSLMSRNSLTNLELVCYILRNNFMASI
jgi:hypothetical protein